MGHRQALRYIASADSLRKRDHGPLVRDFDGSIGDGILRPEQLSAVNKVLQNLDLSDETAVAAALHTIRMNIVACAAIQSIECAGEQRAYLVIEANRTHSKIFPPGARKFGKRAEFSFGPKRPIHAPDNTLKAAIERAARLDSDSLDVNRRLLDSPESVLASVSRESVDVSNPSGDNKWRSEEVAFVDFDLPLEGVQLRPRPYAPLNLYYLGAQDWPHSYLKRAPHRICNGYDVQLDTFQPIQYALSAGLHWPAEFALTNPNPLFHNQFLFSVIRRAFPETAVRAHDTRTAPSWLWQRIYQVQEGSTPLPEEGVRTFRTKDDNQVRVEFGHPLKTRLSVPRFGLSVEDNGRPHLHLRHITSGCYVNELN